MTNTDTIRVRTFMPRRVMTSVFILAMATVALAAGNATVCFHVTCKTNQIEATNGTTIRFTAKKGAKVLDGAASVHTFPKGSSAATASAHYGAQLAAAGFVEGTDYSVAGNCIILKNVDHIDGGTAKVSQYNITWAHTGGVSVGGAPAAGGEVKLPPGQPPTAPATGQFSLSAFGVSPGSGADTMAMTGATEHLSVYQGDTMEEVLNKFQTRLQNNGWVVSRPGTDTLHVTNLPGGVAISSISVTYRAGASMLSAGADYECSDGTIDQDGIIHWQLRVLD